MNYAYPMAVYTPDDIRDMVDDWLFDHYDTVTDLVIDDEPYYSDGYWQQDAHDDRCAYSLVADRDGNINIYYSGTL